MNINTKKRWVFYLILAVAIAHIGFVSAVDDLITLQGNVKQSGVDLSSGNLTVYVFDAGSGGAAIFNSTLDPEGFLNDSIVSGKYDVLLGNSSSNELSLEYGRLYYLEMFVNDEKFSFNGSDRQVFQSSVGQINGTYINANQINTTHITGNITIAQLQARENIVFRNDSVTFTDTNNITLGENGWFQGLFNWIINTTSSIYLSFNGTTLAFNEAQLNATIDDRLSGIGDSNETQRLQNLTTYDCPAGQLVIGVHNNGTVLCASDADTPDTNETQRFQNLTGYSCSGTDKVTGVHPNGTVICSSDTDTTIANETTRVANLVNGDCAAGEKVTGIQNNGTVVCSSEVGANETIRLQNLTAYDCPAGENVVGIHNNGTVICSSNNPFNQTLDTSSQVTFGDLNVTNVFRVGSATIHADSSGSLNITANTNFNGGWQDDGVSIIDGDVFARTLFVYNITSLGVTNLDVNGTLRPGINNTFDVGTYNRSYRDAYFTNEIYIAGVAVSPVLPFNYNQTTPALDTLNSVNTTTNIQNLLNSTDIYSTFNSSYDSIARSPWVTNGSNITNASTTGVGIGTNVPSDLLHLYTDSNSDFGIRIENDAAGGDTDLDLHINETGQGRIQFREGGTARLSLGVDIAKEEFCITESSGVCADNSNDRLNVNYSSNDVLLNPYGGGNVGIGLSDPSHLLHVNGSSDGSVVGRFTNTHATNGYGVLIEGGDDSNVYALSVRDVSSNELLRVRGDGNVGIGTSNPSAELHVNSSGTTFAIVDSNGANDAYLVLDSDAGEWNYVATYNSGSEIWRFGDDNNEDFIVRDAATTERKFVIQDGGNAVAYFDNVTGVGIGTASPDTELDISADAQPAITFNSLDTGITLNENLGQLRFETSDSNIGSSVETARIQARAEQEFTAGNAATGLVFYTSNDGGGLVEQVRIDGDGLVGIGTATPESVLEISSTGNPTFTIKEEATGVASSTRTVNIMNFEGRDNADAEVTFGAFQIDSLDATAGGEDASLLFQTIDDGTLATRMAIRESNVGIGTSSPTDLLHVFSADAGSVTANSLTDELVVEGSDRVGISILHPDGTDGNLFFGSPGDSIAAGLRWNYTSGNFQIGTANAGANLTFMTANFVEAMRITPTGEVGIGATNPTSVLDIRSKSAGDGIFFYDSVDASLIGRIIESGTSGGGLLILEDEASNIGARISGEGELDSYVGVDGGNFGIGHSGPFVELDVEGRFTVAPGGSSNFNLNTEFINVGTVLQENYDYDEDSNGTLLIVSDSIAGDGVGFAIDGHANNNIDLYIGRRHSGDTRFVPQITLESATGEVGIGVEDPTATLEVDGNTKVNGNINVTGFGDNLSMGDGRIYWDNANSRLVIEVS